MKRMPQNNYVLYKNVFTNKFCVHLTIFHFLILSLTQITIIMYNEYNWLRFTVCLWCVDNNIKLSVNCRKPNHGVGVSVMVRIFKTGGCMTKRVLLYCNWLHNDVSDHHHHHHYCSSLHIVNTIIYSGMYSIVYSCQHSAGWLLTLSLLECSVISLNFFPMTTLKILQSSFLILHINST